MLSIRKRTVLLIMSVMGLLYITLYYLTGVVYGLYYALVRLSVSSFFTYVLPIAAVIVSCEVIRHVLISQSVRAASIVAYLIGVLSEVLIDANFGGSSSFHQLADILGYTVFPAITAGVLYHYLSRRYGVYPNISYRLLTTLFPYLIPYSSQLSAAIYSFARLVIPLLIYAFIHALYGKRERQTSTQKVRWTYVVVAPAILLASSFVMLISCQFEYGLIVVATESMTGELNKGDVAIYQKYEGQDLEEGTIIVFDKGDGTTVHRIVKIEVVDGTIRYTTKGDANDDNDLGYVYKSDIKGTTLFKVAYFGYPTLWLRSLFKRA
jgi:signal peptidase I